MPPGIPVATVGINGATERRHPCRTNAFIGTIKNSKQTFIAYKEGLKKKIVKANEELKEIKYEFKTN